MLENRQQDFIARLEQRSEGKCCEVDRGSGAVSEEDFPGGIGVEKAGDATARFIIRRRGRACEPMHALVNVGTCLNLEPTQCAKYDLRHLRSRSVVEVMQARVRDPWKLTFDRSCIEALIRSARLHLTLPLWSNCPSTSATSRAALHCTVSPSFIMQSLVVVSYNLAAR